jgi:transcription antitermination factor NusG
MAHMPLDASVMAAVDTAAPVANHLGCHSIRWACVYTQPQAETWAASNLTTAGYRVWFPTTVVQRRDRATPTIRHAVTVPLFPRYGFIAFDHRDTSWSPIRDTPGVVDLVRCGSLPAYTSDTHVEALRSALDAAEAQGATTYRQGTSWAPGTILTVTRGIFSQHQGTLLRLLTRDRAVVMLLLFGELRQVVVPIADLLAGQNLGD